MTSEELREEIAIELENSGEIWHVELFRRFCEPPFPSLPVLLDESLSSDLAPYRKFRHVVHHGYGFQLDWERMAEGIEQVNGIYKRLKKRIGDYLESL